MADQALEWRLIVKAKPERFAEWPLEQRRELLGIIFEDIKVLPMGTGKWRGGWQGDRQVVLTLKVERQTKSDGPVWSF